jgi:DNA-binding MarR family transcriptional regulator
VEYSHSDAELVRQPVGYWTWAAYRAVVDRTRGALAAIGATQPQWWVLAQVARAGGPKPRAEVTATLKGYLDTGTDGVRAAIDETAARGWTAEDAEGRLTLTDEGRAFFDKADRLQDDLRAERHTGITDEEYLTTLKVLQRMIHNVGGQAWHH